MIINSHEMLNNEFIIKYNMRKDKKIFGDFNLNRNLKLLKMNLITIIIQKNYFNKI